MKHAQVTLLLTLTCLFATQESTAQFYVSPGTEVHTFSTVYLENTNLENDGEIIVDDYIEFLGDGNMVNVINNAIFEASAIGFTGTNDYQSQGIFDVDDIVMEDAAELYLLSGQWNLGAQIIGETNTRTITGEPGTFIVTMRDGGTVNTFGNIGFELTEAAVNIGETQVFRRYTSIPVGVNDEESILRYYEILPTNNDGLNATGTFRFYNDDLNGLDINSLALYRLGDGDTVWTNEGGDVSIQTDYNTIKTGGINAFSTWAIAADNLILPVKLTFFDAEAIDNLIVLCTWQTASEVNNSHFEVERSEQGLHFEYVGQTPGNGNTTTPQNYDFTDADPYEGYSFYRLKQVDFDGSHEFSDVQQVYIERESGLVVYPNPTQEIVHLTIPSTIEVNQYQIVDMNGRQHLAGDYEHGELSIDVGELAAGMYIINLKSNEQSVRQIKFVKQ